MGLVEVYGKVVPFRVFARKEKESWKT